MPRYRVIVTRTRHGKFWRDETAAFEVVAESEEEADKKALAEAEDGEGDWQSNDLDNEYETDAIGEERIANTMDHAEEITE